MQVFELTEIAKVVGMPLTLARNWTSGRPLRIGASIKQASGIGTRNIFSLEDVYVFAFAFEAYELGLSPKAIEEMLEELKGAVPMWISGRPPLIIFGRKAQEEEGPHLYVASSKGDKRARRAIQLYVDAAKLVKSINERLSSMELIRQELGEEGGQTQ